MSSIKVNKRKDRSGRQDGAYRLDYRPIERRENGETRLPDPVPEPPIVNDRDERDQLGRFVKGTATARSIGARGGSRGRRGPKLAADLGLSRWTENPDFLPYWENARAFSRAQRRELARVAGGRCGPAPSSMVVTASLQLAVSRYLFDRAAQENDTSLLRIASQLGDSSRNNLLGAFDIAAKEAKGRSATSQASSAVDALRDAILTSGESSDE